MSEQPNPLEASTEVGISDIGKDVLFVGNGQSAVGWYRCYLPALFLGADWAGLVGEPGHWAMTTGLVKQQTTWPNFFDYKVVVIQQAAGQRWLKLIRELQDKGGVKVIYEVDDYLHSIRKQDDHDFREHFGKERLKDMEMCMRVCDGMICSTDFIARRYRKFNRNVYVCENGIDMARYRLTRPKRPTVNIMWAGATAHARAVTPWLDVVARVMAYRENTCFISIGQPFADALKDYFPERCITTPFTMIESYPSAMTMGDIALAPAGKSDFYLGKSDLRWLESAALGIPVIADPGVYPHIEHGVTGFHAERPEEVQGLLLGLVDDDKLRTEVGENAREYVSKHRDMSLAATQWAAVFEDVVSS